MIIINQGKAYFINFDNVCQITLAVSEDDKDYGRIGVKL